MLGRGVFASGEDFSPCRLQASLTRSTAQMRTPFCNILLRRWALVLSFHEIKINTIHEGWCSFLWRRKRDSNPRAFWANGFQDRLVVTASIFLHIYGVVHYTIYMQSYFEVARETRFTNPLRIPHEDASSLLVSGKCGYPRQRYSCDVVNHLTNYLIVRHSVRFPILF